MMSSFLTSSILSRHEQSLLFSRLVNVHVFKKYLSQSTVVKGIDLVLLYPWRIWLKYSASYVELLEVVWQIFWNFLTDKFCWTDNYITCLAILKMKSITIVLPDLVFFLLSSTRVYFSIQSRRVFQPEENTDTVSTRVQVIPVSVKTFF